MDAGLKQERKITFWNSSKIERNEVARQSRKAAWQLRVPHWNSKIKLAEIHSEMEIIMNK